MRIAITHTRYTRIGGVEGYVCALVERLLAAGHEVHYFCQWWDADADSRIHFHRVPNPWKPIRFLKVRSYDRAVTRMVKCEDWDVVHGFSKSSVQDVYTDGSGTLEDYQAYSLAGGSRLGQFLRRMSPHQREVAAIERRRFTRGNFKKIIAMSRLAADQICKRYGLTADEVEVIYNGIDLARFTPAPKAGDPLVLLVGNDWRRKGVDTFLFALAKLTDHRWKALVIGKERPAREREMIGLAAGLKLGGRVTFSKPEAAIEKVFAQASLFVLPTRFDIFGQVVLEAMASGVPALVARTAGAAECIRDGVDGVVLQDPKDADELARRLKPLLVDAGERARMGAAALETAKAYSWDRHFQRVLEIYDQVAASKKK